MTRGARVLEVSAARLNGNATRRRPASIGKLINIVLLREKNNNAQQPCHPYNRSIRHQVAYIFLNPVSTIVLALSCNSLVYFPHSTRLSSPVDIRPILYTIIKFERKPLPTSSRRKAFPELSQSHFRPPEATLAVNFPSVSYQFLLQIFICINGEHKQSQPKNRTQRTIKKHETRCSN